MIIAINFFVVFGVQANAGELNYLLFIIKTINWSTLKIADNCRSRGRPRFLLHSFGWLDMTGGFRKYNPYTCEMFASKICLD